MVGDLRIRALNAIGPAVTDAIVCGENQEGVGLLLYPSPTTPRAEVEAAVAKGLADFNARAKGAGARIGRELVLPDGHDANHGEITDKGYCAQPVARARRAAFVERLYADPPSPDVMVFPA